MTERIVLLTGAARGLGRIMALTLLKAGHRVVLSSMDRAALEGVAAESGAGPDRVAIITADLSQRGEAERLADAASAAFGPVEVLINNAGIGIDTLRADYMSNPYNFWEADRAKIDLFLAINTISPMILAARLAPKMIDRGWGRIICNTTSLDTMLRMPLYGGSKAAMEAEVSVMAHNLAGTGVTANVLIPGGATVSRMTERLGLPVDQMFPNTIMSAPIEFLVSDLSEGFTGRRILANRWPTEKPPLEAAAVASDVVAWTGFGAGGVHPQATRQMFRRDSGVGS